MAEFCLDCWNKKKIVNKQYIEGGIILKCRKLLTDKNIDNISQSGAAACEADYDTSAIKRLKTSIREIDTAIENLWKSGKFRALHSSVNSVFKC